MRLGFAMLCAVGSIPEGLRVKAVWAGVPRGTYCCRAEAWIGSVLLLV